MLTHKHFRVPFVLKILNSLHKRNCKHEVEWKIIAANVKWTKPCKEPAVYRISNLLPIKPTKPNFQSLLFSKNSHCVSYIPHPLNIILKPMIFKKSSVTKNITSFINPVVSFSVRSYSQQTSSRVPNSIKWIAVILFGLSAAGISLYLVFPEFFEEINKINFPEYWRNVIEFIEKESIFKEPQQLKFPLDPEQIPDEIPYLIIGGGTSAFAAFRAIKSCDPQAKVLVISNELYYPYMRPPLTKELVFNNSEPDRVNNFIFNQWNGKKRSVFFEPEEFYASCEELVSLDNGGVSVARGWNVVELDPNNKCAILDGGKTIKYGKCLLATGSIPKDFPILSNSNPLVSNKVSYYRSLKDFSKLDIITKDNNKSVIVVGGGFCGTELACSLARKGIKVALLFKEENVLIKVLPEYLAKSVTNKLRELGVDVINNVKIEQAQLINDKICLSMKNGHQVSGDHVVLALGVTPNTTLAQKAGLEIDPNLGGYVTNTEFQIRKDLYAAGDCASFFDAKFGRRRIEHHDHAVLSGRIAGENMTGRGKSFKIQSMFWSDIAPQLGFEAVGIVDPSLPTVGVFVKNAVILDSENSETPEEGDKERSFKLDRGVVFYMKNKMVVGVVLWNLYNRISIARRVLKSEVPFEDLSEVAKHFKLYNIKT